MFISEYLNISEKYIFEEEIIKKEIVEDKKEIIQEKKEEIASPNIKKKIDKEQFIEKKIEILKGDTFVSILENLNFKQKKIYEIISKIEESYDLKKIKTGEIISVFENNFGEIKKIEFFLNMSQDQRNQMGKNGRNKILDNFHKQNNLDGEIIRIFEKLIDDSFPLHACFTNNQKWFNVNDLSQLESSRDFFGP